MKNITITLDEETAAWVRVQAAERGSSVSRLVGELLRGQMAEARAYDEAMQRFLARPPARLKRRGTEYPTRDALHDRPDLR